MSVWVPFQQVHDVQPHIFEDSIRILAGKFSPHAQSLQNLKYIIMQKLLIEGPEPSKDFSYPWVQGHQDLKTIEAAFPVSNFTEEMEKRDLEMEFRLLRRLTETQYHNENLVDFNPDIQKLNRYNNILPFKHSLVQLIHDGDEEDQHKDSYINANYITCVDGEQRSIIATQGPLQNTTSHFWKMVYQENLNLIVMLCNLKENGKVQCEQYWPKQPEEVMQCGSLKIRLESTEECGHALIHRHFKLSMDGSPEERLVTQIHWQGWADQGVPQAQDFDVIMKIVNFIVTSLEKKQKVTFHCSAGVGRTGTLISLCNLMMILRYYLQSVGNDPKKIDETPENFKLTVFGTVRRLREQRWGMVHTSEQYIYLYKFLDKAIKSLMGK